MIGCGSNAQVGHVVVDGACRAERRQECPKSTFRAPPPKYSVEPPLEGLSWIHIIGHRWRIRKERVTGLSFMILHNRQHWSETNTNKSTIHSCWCVHYTQLVERSCPLQPHPPVSEASEHHNGLEKQSPTCALSQ